MDENKPSIGSTLTRYAGEVGLFFLELLKIALLAGITIFLIRHFLFKPFYVKGASMEPSFNDHEYLIIDELTFRLRPPERGEVIVFKYPENKNEYFLKRIVGLPGERVKVAEGKVTIYNMQYPEGAVLDETYLPEVLATAGEKITVLNANQYYVMGDNRPNSFDSRRFGPIDKSLIVGRVVFRGWPANKVQIFSRPNLNV